MAGLCQIPAEWHRVNPSNCWWHRFSASSLSRCRSWNLKITPIFGLIPSQYMFLYVLLYVCFIMSDDLKARYQTLKHVRVFWHGCVYIGYNLLDMLPVLLKELHLHCWLHHATGSPCSADLRNDQVFKWWYVHLLFPSILYLFLFLSMSIYFLNVLWDTYGKMKDVWLEPPEPKEPKRTSFQLLSEKGLSELLEFTPNPSAVFGCQKELFPTRRASHFWRCLGHAVLFGCDLPGSRYCCLKNMKKLYM